MTPPSTTTQTSFEAELANLIVELLNLPDVEPAAIAPDAPLFGDGLGLDSIDALEIAVAIGQRYQVHLRAEDESTRKAFGSLRHLAAYIEASRPHPA